MVAQERRWYNVAELDAIIKGINLALKWKLQQMTLVTDSATVSGWLRSVLTGSHRARVSGIAELLVRRRLALVNELVKEFDLDITVQLVRSVANKADVLTRVPRTWLRAGKSSIDLKALHARHHFGVQRSKWIKL